MNKEQIIQEIGRVEDALSKTKSPYLKRDFEKYLKRLRNMLNKVSNGR